MICKVFGLVNLKLEDLNFGRFEEAREVLSKNAQDA